MTNFACVVRYGYEAIVSGMPDATAAAAENQKSTLYLLLFYHLV